MGRFADRVRALAQVWGAPGLFAVAFLDSTFLPLPGIADVLLIVLITGRKEHAVWYVITAVLGSIAGSLTMHAIGRKGGEAFVRGRFTGDRVERALESLRRYGIISVLVPSLLPPPAPFKIFVLLAGVVGISAARLATAIAIGRGVRYAVVGYLAIRYGDLAGTYLAEHGEAAALALAGLLAAGFAVFLLWRRAR